MATAITLVTLTQFGVMAAVAMGCATRGQAIAHDRASTIRTSSTRVGVDGSVTPAPRRTGDVLSAAELSAAQAVANVYDAVMQLRPGFLNAANVRMGIAAPGVLPAVFLNGAFSGGPELLRGIMVSDVAEMQFVRSIDAMHRYGPQYGAGVILVRLR